MALNSVDRGHCLTLIDALCARCPDIDAVMLVLRDGRPFAEKTRASVEPGRMGAMTSSLVALGQSVLKELQAGPMDHILIDGAAGKLVISVIPGTGGLMLLAVLAARDARLGLVLGQAKMCSQEVSLVIAEAGRR